MTFDEETAAIISTAKMARGLASGALPTMAAATALLTAALATVAEHYGPDASTAATRALLNPTLAGLGLQVVALEGKPTPAANGGELESIKPLLERFVTIATCEASHPAVGVTALVSAAAFILSRTFPPDQAAQHIIAGAMDALGLASPAGSA